MSTGAQVGGAANGAAAKKKPRTSRVLSSAEKEAKVLGQLVVLLQPVENEATRAAGIALVHDSKSLGLDVLVKLVRYAETLTFPQRERIAATLCAMLMIKEPIKD